MSPRFDPNHIWRVREDLYTSFTFGNMCVKDETIGIDNEREMDKSYRKIAENFDRSLYHYVRLPPEFPVPIMHFPSSGFAPDYFSFGSVDFCSARLRDALAQPSDVIEYTPIDLRCDGAKAIAQEYQRMRILAVQPTMDMQRSLYESQEWVHPETGETSIWIREIEKLVLQEGFRPRTEIFCIEEHNLPVLATDALAERVLKAGCTGLEFSHLETPDYDLNVPVTIRTKRGVSLRKERRLPRAED
jgi:hypothetical protein